LRQAYKNTKRFWLLLSQPYSLDWAVLFSGPHVHFPLHPSSAFFVLASKVGFSHIREMSEVDSRAPSKWAPFKFAQIPVAGSFPNVAPAPRSEPQVLGEGD
jgi:hypothetical protein